MRLLLTLPLLQRTSILLIIRLLTLPKQPHEPTPTPRHAVISPHKRRRKETGNLCEPLIREYPNQHTPRQTKRRNKDRNRPLHTIQTIGVNVENTASDEDDSDLQTDHDGVDEDEEQVAVDADEDVELVVESAAVELVEDLHPDKHVEDDSVELELFGGDGGVVAEDGVAGEVENQDDDDLEDGLADDHLPHLGLLVVKVKGR